MIYRIISSTVVIFAIGCAASLPDALRNPESSDVGIIGADLELHNSLGFSTETQGVIFARLLNGRDRKGGVEIVASNFKQGSLAYVLNAMPGKYEMIGTYRGTVFAFFDEAMVSQTGLQVDANRVAYAGTWQAELVDGKQAVTSGDATQLFYLPEVYKHSSKGTGFDWTAVLKSVQKDAAAKSRFFARSKEIFGETGWAGHFEKSLE